jgi:DNA-binding GntR family transcriptional regulator
MIVSTEDGKLERRTIASAAAEAIRQRILNGDFAEGESLRQDALAGELGISRIPVREAFRQLEAEGLVTLLPHRGAVVSALSVEEIAEIFDLRAVLEPDLLTHALPRLTAADLQRAATILDEFERALAAGDVHAWGEMNTRFHLALYAPSGRRRSLAIVQSLLANADRYTRMQLVLTRGTERAQAEHRALLTLCETGEAEAAIKLLARHIEAAGRDLGAFLEQRQTGQTTRRKARVR